MGLVALTFLETMDWQTVYSSANRYATYSQWELEHSRGGSIEHILKTHLLPRGELLAVDWVSALFQSWDQNRRVLSPSVVSATVPNLYLLES